MLPTAQDDVLSFVHNSKHIWFAVIDEERNQKTFTFKKLE